MSVYGMDFRRKVVAALEQGHPVSTVADRFDIDQKTVRAYRRRAAQDNLEPLRSGPRHPTKLTAADHQALLQQVKANPGITLQALTCVVSVPVAASTVHRALEKLKISFKKSR